ncbi:hypothetical protein [Colwellia sp. TT2012]|uniref:hypothetical protein n=1 Tax=Colwellia sp. TT2012 TaxID=1720342 RepID=UPI000AFBCD59|nr:hypothetical protein [Colwellia sp. TT2012]
MINKKTLKSMLSFTESQHPAPSFIVIYMITWLAWHNQLFTHFINVQGDFFTKVAAALSSIDDNQYIVVFLLTGLIFIVRLGVNYLSFKSKQLLNSADDDFVNARDEQKYAKSNDITNLMATLTKTQQQLAESRAREQKVTAEKNNAIKKFLTVQHALDEARADIEMLNNSKVS